MTEIRLPFHSVKQSADLQATTILKLSDLNLLIAIGFLGLSSLSWTLRQLNRQLKSKTELDLQYVALAFLLTLTVVQPFVPTKKFFEPTLKIWAAQSMEDFPKDYSVLHGRGYLSLPSLAGPSSLDADRVAGAWMILLSAMLTLGSFVMIRDLRKLYILRQRSFLIRRIRNVRIYANDEILVPFSYWLPTQASVVIPAQFIGHREFYKIAVAHELQHHRQGDTSWVYILWGLRLFCVANPFIHLWSRWISEIQEFACDETLVDQNKVDSKAYARCLIEVAQTAICQKYVPVCATGLTFLIERNILKRRIQKMIRKNVAKPWKPVGTAFGLALASLMAVTAFATKNVVQDRRVSMEQALAMAKNVQGKTAFPVVVNKLVLKQLNRYIGTPEGRDFMRSSLQRMENYRKVVEQKITDYGVPEELMAIPIVESGYQNLIESKKIGWGAGLWMFIAPTARVYGLKVNAQVDERLNVDLLTDAAFRYLQSNYLRFKDWQLATLAYNVGENNLQTAIDKTGSRDAWSIIRRGFENDRDYLPRVVAAILIMKNPDSVK